jgi:hypothetical protein
MAISLKEFTDAIANNTPSGKQVIDVFVKTEDASNGKLDDLAKMFKKVQEDVKSTQEALSGEQTTSNQQVLENYFGVLQSLEKTLEKFLDPTYKMNKNEADAMKELIDTEKTMSNEIMELRMDDKKFNQELKEIEKRKDTELFREGIADEEEREFTKKWQNNSLEMWDDVRSNIGALSTEHVQDLGQSLLAGFGGHNALLLQQLAGPLISKIGESDIFGNLKEKVGGFFSMRSKESEPTDDSDKLIEAIDDVVLPPIGIERRKAIQENRVKKNLAGGDKVDLDTLAAIKEGNQEIVDSIKDLNEQIASASDGLQTMGEFPDQLAELMVIQDKISEMTETQVSDMREALLDNKEALRELVSQEDIDQKKSDVFLDSVSPGEVEAEKEFRDDQKELMEDQLEMLKDVDENTEKKGFDWVKLAALGIGILIPLLMDKVLPWLIKGFQWLGDLPTHLGKLWDNIKDLAKDIYDSVSTALQDAWTWIKDSMHEMFINTFNGIVDVINMIPGVNVSKMDNPYDEQNKREQLVDDVLTQATKIANEGAREAMERVIEKNAEGGFSDEELDKMVKDMKTYQDNPNSPLYKDPAIMEIEKMMVKEKARRDATPFTNRGDQSTKSSPAAYQNNVPLNDAPVQLDNMGIMLLQANKV